MSLRSIFDDEFFSTIPPKLKHIVMDRIKWTNHKIKSMIQDWFVCESTMFRIHMSVGAGKKTKKFRKKTKIKVDEPDQIENESKLSNDDNASDENSSTSFDLEDKLLITNEVAIETDSWVDDLKRVELELKANVEQFNMHLMTCDSIGKDKTISGLEREIKENLEQSHHKILSLKNDIKESKISQELLMTQTKELTAKLKKCEENHIDKTEIPVAVIKPVVKKDQQLEFLKEIKRIKGNVNDLDSTTFVPICAKIYSSVESIRKMLSSTSAGLILDVLFLVIKKLYDAMDKIMMKVSIIMSSASGSMDMNEILKFLEKKD